MSDRLEESKLYLKYLKGYWPEPTQESELFDWLIQEVERLRGMPQGLGLMLQCDQMESEIESITKERDKLKQEKIARMKLDEQRNRTAAQVLLNRCNTVSKESGKPVSEIEEILYRVNLLEKENAELNEKLIEAEKKIELLRKTGKHRGYIGQ